MISHSQVHVLRWSIFVMAKGLFPRAWVKKSFYFQVISLVDSCCVKRIYMCVCVYREIFFSCGLWLCVMRSLWCHFRVTAEPTISNTFSCSAGIVGCCKTPKERHRQLERWSWQSSYRSTVICTEHSSGLPLCVAYTVAHDARTYNPGQRENSVRVTSYHLIWSYLKHYCGACQDFHSVVSVIRLDDQSWTFWFEHWPAASIYITALHSKDSTYGLCVCLCVLHDHIITVSGPGNPPERWIMWAEAGQHCPAFSCGPYSWLDSIRSAIIRLHLVSVWK